MSVLGVEIWNWQTAILAFSTLVGPPPAVLGLHLSKTRPSTNSVSSIVPPSFFTILISFKSTFIAVSGSITLKIALTASSLKS